MKDNPVESPVFNEQAARQLVETMNEGLVWLDARHNMVYVNSSFCQITGFEKEELLGKPYINVISPQSVKYVKRQLEERKKGYSGKYEAYLKTKNNGIAFVIISPRAIFDENENFSGSFAVFTDITMRKQVEEELKLSEKKYSILFDASPVGITLSGFYNGKFEAVNESFCNIVEYSPGDLVGKSSIELGLWVDASERSEAVKKAEVDGAVQNHEIRFYTKNGEIRTCQLFSEIIEINNEKFVLSNIVDISEQKKVYQALQYSEEKFSKAFHASPEAMSINNLFTGKYEEVNESFCKMTGYNRDEVIGKSTIELGIWANPSLRKGIVKQLAEGNRVYQLEADFVKKNGEIGTGIYSAEIIHIGDKPSILSAVMDISRRKEAEEALITEKERLRVTLQSIGDAVISTDTSGNIIMMNQVAEEMTAWKQAEASQAQVHEVFNIIEEKTGDVIENPVEKVLRSGSIVELTNHSVLVSRDGSRKIVTYNAAPIKDEDNNVFGVILVFRDVTERIRVEKESIKIQKFEALELLAGGIAHDFNNILTAIMGNINVLKTLLEDNTESMERLKDISLASSRARELTHSLLTFARDGLTSRCVARLDDLARECVDISLTGSAVETVYEISDNLWPVSIDSSRMGQVFQNLAINAIQAMPSGGKLTVKLENTTFEESSTITIDAGHYVVVKISDTGTGIPASVLPRVFDPYFTTKKSGTGLGLATVHSIVKQHNGYIRAESTEGEGTTFTIWLPAFTQNEDKADLNLKNCESIKESKILLLDDDELILEMGKEMLSVLGYDVETFDNFNDMKSKCSHYIDNNTPVIVILDMVMPDRHDVVDCLKELHEIDPAISVLISSGYVDDDKMINPENYGFKGAIPKPYDMKKIEMHLTRVINLE